MQTLHYQNSVKMLIFLGLFLKKSTWNLMFLKIYRQNLRLIILLMLVNTNIILFQTFWFNPYILRFKIN